VGTKKARTEKVGTTEEAKQEAIAIETEVKKCKKCPLFENRKNAVPGEGSLNARIMLVGEAPGRNEDALGKPFVGAAGRFLNELLEHAGMNRDEIYITNIVKCRPPENRKPLPGETAACMPYLSRQIALIKPGIICILGATALDAILGENEISEMHGKGIERSGVVYFPLYHPAAGIYNRRLRAAMLDDIKNVGKALEMKSG